MLVVTRTGAHCARTLHGSELSRAGSGDRRLRRCEGGEQSWDLRRQGRQVRRGGDITWLWPLRSEHRRLNKQVDRRNVKWIWYGQGDHKIRVCRFDLLFTKDWDFLKIIPLRFSGVLGRLSPFHIREHLTGAHVDPLYVGLGGPVLTAHTHYNILFYENSIFDGEEKKTKEYSENF